MPIVIINGMLCIAFLMVELYMITTALRRNSSVALRGKTSYLPLVVALLVSLVLFVPDERATKIELLRDALFYLALLSSLLVKRGFSERGMELLFVTVPWSSISSIRIEPYLTNKIRTRVLTGSHNISLYFGRYRLQEAGDYLVSFFPNLVVESGLAKKGDGKKCK